VANIEVAAVADERRVVCALVGYQTMKIIRKRKATQLNAGQMRR